MCGVCESSCECCQRKLGVVRKREIAVATGRRFTGSELKSRWENRKTTMCVGKGQPRWGKSCTQFLYFIVRDIEQEEGGAVKKKNKWDLQRQRNKANLKWKTQDKVGLHMSWGPQQRQQSFVRRIGAEEKWHTLHQETESILPHRKGYELRETQQVTAIALKCQHDQGSLLHHQ